MSHDSSIKRFKNASALCTAWTKERSCLKNSGIWGEFQPASIAGHCGHCSSVSLYFCDQPPTPIPSSFVAPCQHVLGRVQLFPLFLDGNATSTIPYKYHQHQLAKFPHGSTDSTNAAGRKGSNVYSVNLWQFGRGRPLLDGLSVADAEDRRTELQTDSHTRDVETQAPHCAEGCKVTWH